MGAAARATLIAKESTALGDQSQCLLSRLAIAAPVLASIAFVLELTVTPAIIPTIQSQLGAELRVLSLFQNAYSFAVAVGVLISGYFGDRHFKTGVFALGSALFSIGSFAMVMSYAANTLLAGRLIQGVGAGLLLPFIPVLLTQATAGRPGRILITWGAVSGFVAALAPVAYGYFLCDDNWRVTYAFLGTLGFLSLVFGTLSRIAPSGTRVAKGSISRRSIFSDSGLLAIFAYIFCTYGAVTYFLFKAPLLLTEADFSATEVGGALTVAWLSFSAMSIGIRNLVDREWLCTILFAAPVFMACGLLLIALPPSTFSILAASFLVGTGLACSNSPSTQVVLRLAPNSMHAFVSGIDITAARLGGILTLSLAAALTPETQTIVLFGLLIASLMAMRWVVRRLGTQISMTAPDAT